MDRITKNFVLQRGRIGNKNFLAFATYNYETAMKEVPNGVLFFLKDKTDWNFYDVAWSMISLDICMEPSVMCFVLGRDGEVLVGSKSGFDEERIDDQGANPSNRGPLQNIRLINGTAIAIGMGRQVYQRVGSNYWLRLEKGIPDPPPGPEIVGFNAIAGRSLNDIYVVGWKGEIWHYDGRIWSLIDSPTNVTLHDVLISPDSTIYTCGHDGLLLKGHGKDWDIIDYNGPAPNWRTMAWFRENLYLADGQNIYLLEENTIVPVKVDDDGPMPVISLHSTDELLLAVAADSAYTTDDGEKWMEVPC